MVKLLHCHWKQSPMTSKEIFEGHTLLSKEFRNNIRAYNCAFSFVSLGANIDNILATYRNVMYPFCLQNIKDKCIISLALFFLRKKIKVLLMHIFFQYPYYDQVQDMNFSKSKCWYSSQYSRNSAKIQQSVRSFVPTCKWNRKKILLQTYFKIYWLQRTRQETL